MPRPLPSLPSAAFAVLALLLSPRPAAALQPLSDFFAGARTRSTAERAAALATAEQEAVAGAASGRLLPALTAVGTYTRRQHEGSAAVAAGASVVTAPREALDGSLQLSVPLVDVGAWDRARGAAHLARAAGRSAEATRAEIERQVALAYGRFVNAGAQRRASERAGAAPEEGLSLARARRAAGTATDLDVARAIAEAEGAARALADEALASAIARRELTTLSGLEPTGDVDEPETALDPEPPLPDWERVALARSPALAAAFEQRAGVEALRTAALHDLLPTLSGILTEQATSASGQEPSPSFTGVIALTWRVDVPAIQEVRAQRAAAAQAQVAVERAADDVRDAVHEAWHRVEAGVAQGRATRAQTEAAALAEQLAAQRYGAGSGTQLELIQAQRDRTAAEAARIQADADLRYARIALRLAAGLAPDASLPSTSAAPVASH